MKGRLLKRHAVPRKPMELFDIPSKIRNTFPDSSVQNLVASMTACIAMVKENRDGPTKH